MNRIQTYFLQSLMLRQSLRRILGKPKEEDESMQPPLAAAELSESEQEAAIEREAERREHEEG